jgi:hypothetical protein
VRRLWRYSEATGPDWPWYLEPRSGWPYGRSTGSSSRMKEICPIFMPGHRRIGRVATLLSSSVIWPLKPILAGVVQRQNISFPS